MRLVSRSILVALPFALLLSMASRWAAAAPDGDFRPYTPAESTEPISAPLFVVIAYSAIWLLVLLFVVSVWLRQRRVEAELAQVRQRLEQLGSS